MKKFLFTYLIIIITIFGQQKQKTLKNYFSNIINNYNQEALSLFLQKNFPSSIAKYQQALIYIDSLKVKPKFLKMKKKSLKKKLLSVYETWIRELIKESSYKNYKQALQVVGNALQLFPNYSNFLSLEKSIKKLLKTLKYTDNVTDSKKQKIFFMLFKAKSLISTKGNYLEASHVLQEILEIDPYNSQAIKLLKSINFKLEKIGLRRSIQQINVYNNNWSQVLAY